MKPLDFRVDELEGGARLVTAPMPDRASVSLALMFSVGSRYESDRLGGISHFIEHLFFKGTTRRPSAQLIAEAIEGVGGVMNASTDKEVTTYWTKVPDTHVALAADVLFDIVSDSRLTPEDIERERTVILEELKMYQDLPQDHVHSIFEEIMWPGHPLGRDIGGTLASVAALSRNDLVEFVSDYYGRSKLVISASGLIDSAGMTKLISERLALTGSASGNGYAPPPPALTSAAVRLQRKDTEQAHICIGTRGLSYLDEDRYNLDLLNTILGEGMSSRLFLEIREKRGLAYDVHSYTSKHRDCGYFAVYTGVDPSKADEAVAAIVAELRKVVDSDVPEVELEKARQFTLGRLKLGLESTNAMASWLGQQQLLAGRIRTLEEVVNAIEGVTVESIRQVAKRVLDQPLQMAIIGPFDSDATFRRAIGA